MCSDRKIEIITETKDELEQVRNNVHKLQQEVCLSVYDPLSIYLCVSLCLCLSMKFGSHSYY